MTCSLGNMRGCICILACSRVRFISIFFVFFHQKQQLFVFSFLMDREIYHTLYVSFTIIIMCSLCITSITNINARLSAGGRDKTSVRFSVHVCRCRVNMSVLRICVYFVKRARRILYEDSFWEQTGMGVISRYTAKRGEMHSLKYNKYRGL